MSDRWTDVGLLALRLGAGATLAAHGAQKLFGWFGGGGVKGTGKFFDSMGFTPGDRNATIAGICEAGGGLLLAAGLATGPAGAALLGNMAVLRGGESLALPRSKKTRALLAYLAVTGRAHRRERLCELLWDVPDDPRGALRWSLSKLRALVDEPGGPPHLVAGRETLDTTGIELDLLMVLLPMLRLSLAVMWFWAGFVSIWVYPLEESYRLLAGAGVPAPPCSALLARSASAVRTNFDGRAWKSCAA